MLDLKKLGALKHVKLSAEHLRISNLELSGACIVFFVVFKNGIKRVMSTGILEQVL